MYRTVMAISLVLLALLLISTVQASEWQVSITAVFPSHNDTSTFGVRDDATLGFDRHIDLIEPPPPPDRARAYFYYPDYPEGLKKLSESYINESYIMEWPLVVEYPGTSTMISLVWNETDLSDVLSYYSLELINESGEVIDMRTQNSYSFTTQITKKYYNFTIRVADSEKPIAVIDVPAEDSFVKGVITITGTANDVYFANYTIKITNETGAVVFSYTNTTPVQNNVLATWNTTF